MRALFKQYQKVIGFSLLDLKQTIRKNFAKAEIPAKVKARQKVKTSIKKKMKAKNLATPFQISDLYALRIVVRDLSDVKRVGQVLSSLGMNIRLKHDYIENPKVREGAGFVGKAYRAVHWLGLINALAFEVQVTTTAFYKQNNKLHFGYKAKA